MQNDNDIAWYTVVPKNTIQSNIKNFSIREIHWIWSLLNMSNIYSLGPNSSITQKKEILNNHINTFQNKNEVIQNLKINIENHLVPLEYLDWIKESDNRKIIWLLNKLNLDFNMVIKIGISSTLYKEFLLNFDSINVDINQKIIFIQNKKIEWEVIKTQEKLINWIDISNKTQLTWSWDYLIKFYKNINYFYPPQSNTDLYNAILASFDNMSYEHISDKKLFMDRMKKTWSQKKFRDSGKAKKPYHIPLTKSTQAQLEKLAEFKNLHKNQVIEELIMKEYEATQLDEKGKSKY